MTRAEGRALPRRIQGQKVAQILAALTSYLSFATANALQLQPRSETLTLSSSQLLRLAADGDFAPAQFQLGLMYDLGQGVPKDYAEAMKWYRKAADQGDAGAQRNLGTLYYHGHGVPQDYAEAMKWARKAADQGDASAQTWLGLMYDLGQGVPQDYVEAHKWSNLAAARASDKGMRGLATENRDRVAAAMTPAQIAEAQKLAREWKPAPPVE